MVCWRRGSVTVSQLRRWKSWTVSRPGRMARMVTHSGLLTPTAADRPRAADVPRRQLTSTMPGSP